MAARCSFAVYQLMKPWPDGRVPSTAGKRKSSPVAAIHGPLLLRASAFWNARVSPGAPGERSRASSAPSSSAPMTAVVIPCP